MEQNIIGTTIAALRREKGLTQDALAAQLGTALFTSLFLGVVITRDIVEFIRVSFEGCKA